MSASLLLLNFYSLFILASTFLYYESYLSNITIHFGYVFTRNDLWALGCTLYQMLSGTSPFKDASEWLIFQRIIARDIRFPNYFSNEARDIIDQLLVRYHFVFNIHFHPVVPLSVSPIMLAFFLFMFYTLHFSI